jgi:hypothetical protein
MKKTLKEKMSEPKRAGRKMAPGVPVPNSDPPPKVYFGLWLGYTEMLNSFKTAPDGGYGDRTEVPENMPKAKDILFAAYIDEDYSGEAIVLFKGKDGQLMEVTGSHCSCYGLEGQWIPGKVTWAALALRTKDMDGSYGSPMHRYSEEVRTAFKDLVASHV